MSPPGGACGVGQVVVFVRHPPGRQAEGGASPSRGMQRDAPSTGEAHQPQQGRDVHALQLLVPGSSAVRRQSLTAVGVPH